MNVYLQYYDLLVRLQSVCVTFIAIESSWGIISGLIWSKLNNLGWTVFLIKNGSNSCSVHWVWKFLKTIFNWSVSDRLIIGSGELSQKQTISFVLRFFLQYLKQLIAGKSISERPNWIKSHRSQWCWLWAPLVLSSSWVYQKILFNANLFDCRGNQYKLFKLF